MTNDWELPISLREAIQSKVDKVTYGSRNRVGRYFCRQIAIGILEELESLQVLGLNILFYFVINYRYQDEKN